MRNATACVIKLESSDFAAQMLPPLETAEAFV